MKVGLERTAAPDAPARLPALGRDPPQRVGADAQPPVAYRYGDVAVARRCPCGGLTTAGGECEACRQRRLAREAVDDRLRGPSDPSSYGLTQMALRLRERSSGTPLDPASRERIETRSGRTLGPVRVHDDAPARAAAALLGARAFTLGQDVYLGNGARSPSVLDHEAVHTLQQRPWRGEPLRVDGAGDHEREAEQVASGGGPVAIAARAPAPMPLALAAWLILAGEAACLFGFYIYALTNLVHKGDKYLHCWTSCKIGTYCAAPLSAQVIALIIGAAKELLDIVIGEAEIRDMKNNVAGVECSLHYLTSCDECCSAKLSAGELAEAEGGEEGEVTDETVEEAVA